MIAQVFNLPVSAEWIIVFGTVLGVWARLERRLTRLETKVDNWEHKKR